MRLHTYSIVAYDPKTGELGVAVQSHFFAVGPICCWVRPGVGAVATQATLAPALGARGLDLLAQGRDSGSVLRELLADDSLSASRQLGIVDSNGRVASHTGDDCLIYANHVQGEHFSCQANMMLNPGVPEAMAQAYESAGDVELERKLLAALWAAQALGGDMRGQQSAALLTVNATGKAWERKFDVRVDDHTEPLRELERLVGLQAAYNCASQAEDLLAAGDIDQATQLFNQAVDLAPEAKELQFWAAFGRIESGEISEGVRMLRELIEGNSGWLTLLERLPGDNTQLALAELSS